MNKLARSVLVMYSYDPNPDEVGLKNVLRQSIELIARMPTWRPTATWPSGTTSTGRACSSTTAQGPEHRREPPAPDASGQPLHPPGSRDLDLALTLHAEHGGGNNSTFTVRVVTSSATDTYSAIAAGIGSLKGPLHGGANLKVREMMEDIKSAVKDWQDEDEVAGLPGEDRAQGNLRPHRPDLRDRARHLHPVGPPAVLLQEKAADLAAEKSLEKEFELYRLVARQAPEVLKKEKNSTRWWRPTWTSTRASSTTC